MRPAGKERGPRTAAGVAEAYVEDVSGEATTYAGMKLEPQ